MCVEIFGEKLKSSKILVFEGNSEFWPNYLVAFHALLTYTDTLNILAKILFTGYGIWNLEFFHYVVPPFCVSENIRNVHTVKKLGLLT